VEGKPYNAQQVDNGEKLVVISEHLRQTYFGEDQPATGKFIEVDNKAYRVSGVVKNISEAHKYQFADAFLPYKESKRVNLTSKALDGIFIGTLLIDPKDDISQVQEEYSQLVSRINPGDERYEKAHSYAGPFLTTFTRSLVDADGSDSGVAKFITIGILLFILFLLLPTLNLVNLNISRIYERASEIGVRKAYGASSGVLVIQFMTENIIITLLGGVMGILLSWIIIQVINDGMFLSNLSLSINVAVMVYSLIACLVFGLISGVYPAWRMSKLHVVNALKAN
jgi:putative ABC transport system permease protein